MELENTFYIMAIVYMSLMFLAMIALLAAVLKIKAKITHIHKEIEAKINSVTSVFDTVEAVGSKAINTAKKVMRK